MGQHMWVSHCSGLAVLTGETYSFFTTKKVCVVCVCMCVCRWIDNLFYLWFQNTRKDQWKPCYISMNLKALRPYNTVDISTHSEYQKTWCNYFCEIASGMFPVLNSTVIAIAICRIKCNFVLAKERPFTLFSLLLFKERHSEFLILYWHLALSDVSLPL